MGNKVAVVSPEKLDRLKGWARLLHNTQTFKSKGGYPHLLVGAVLMLALLHVASAASNRADTSQGMTVSEVDGDVVVNPVNPIVTVATVSRGRKARHPKRTSIGRRASAHELVITTSVDNGPTGRRKSVARAKRQQHLQEYQPDEQELLQEQQMVQDDNDSLFKQLQKQSEQDKLKGLTKPAASSVSTSSSKKSPVRSAAAASSAAFRKASTAAGASSTGSTGAIDSSNEENEGTAANSAAAEEGTLSGSLESEAGDAADSSDSSSGLSKKSRQSSNKHNKQGAATTSRTKAKKVVPDKAQWALIQQPDFDNSAAADELDEADSEAELYGSTGEAEEEAVLAELDSDVDDSAPAAEEVGTTDALSAADEDAEDVPVQHTSSSSRSKASGGSRVHTTKKMSAKHSHGSTSTSSKAKAAGGGAKHKATQTAAKQVLPDAEQTDDAEDGFSSLEADTLADAAAAPGNLNSAENTTTSTSSSATAVDAADSMPWTLTSRSKTISLATPGQQGDADTDESSGAAATAPNATAALAAVAVAATRRVSAAGTTGSSSSSSSSSGGASTGDALQSKSTTLSAQDISQQLAASLTGSANNHQVPASGSAAASSSQQVPAPAQTVDDADGDDGLQLLDASENESDGSPSLLGTSASDLDATASAMGLSSSKSGKNVNGASSSVSSSVSVAALSSTPKQDRAQPVLGGASAELLHKAMDRVALMRDVVFKLAAKPNLLQYIQQKQIRQIADTLNEADVAEMSSIPGLLGLPTVYRAGDDVDSQLYAKKTALAVAMTLFSHMTADQAVTMAGMLIPGYVTPGLTFEQLNKRLYDAAINTQLDEIFDAVMTGQSSTNPGTAAGGDAGELDDGAADQPAARTVNVAKSAKVAGFLVLALLLQARALVCGL